MSTPYYDPNKFATIKSYIMIAFIFTIIALVAFAISAVWQIYTYATWSAYLTYYGVVGTGALVTGIVMLVFLVMTVLVFLRVRRMFTAANQGDVNTLKMYNNMMWAILALIFAGVLPGIMLLISFGPINELGGAAAPQQGAYPPPPPPPM